MKMLSFSHTLLFRCPEWEEKLAMEVLSDCPTHRCEVVTGSSVLEGGLLTGVLPKMAVLLVGFDTTFSVFPHWNLRNKRTKGFLLKV